MSSLPTLSANLEAFKASAKVYAVISVTHETGKQSALHLARSKLIWVIDIAITKPFLALSEKIRSLEWIEGAPYPCVAGKFKGMREMRRFFRDEMKIDRKHMYVGEYHKTGTTTTG